MKINDIIGKLNIAETYFTEDYVMNREEGVGFEEIVSVLGEPVDEEELDIVAACVLEIMNRRRELVETARKIGKGFPRSG